MKLWEIARNDVDAAVRYYGERRAGLVPGSPMQQSLVAPLLKLQDKPGLLGPALKKAYPDDFAERLAGRRQTRPRASEGPARA